MTRTRQQRAVKGAEGTVLLLGNCRSALAAVRSLSKARYSTIVGAEVSDNGFAVASRLTTGVWRHKPWRCQEELKDELLQFANERAERDLKWIFPVNERALRLALELREELASDVTLVMPNPRALQTCLHKGDLYEAASSAGLTVPIFKTLRSLGKDEVGRLDIPLPFVLKPAVTQQSSSRYKARIVRQDRDMDGLSEWYESGLELVAQAYVSGARDNVYFAANHGRLVRCVQVRMTRTTRADGTGVAVRGQTVAPANSKIDQTKKIVSYLEYTGVGCTQFLEDEQGTSYLLELNPRLGGTAVPFLGRVGFSAPTVALDLSSQTNTKYPDNPCDYPLGMKYVWFLGDLRRLSDDVRAGETSLVDLPAELLKALLELWRADGHVTWEWSDPLPTMYDYSTYARELFRVLVTRQRRAFLRADHFTKHRRYDVD